MPMRMTMGMEISAFRSDGFIALFLYFLLIGLDANTSPSTISPAEARTLLGIILGSSLLIPPYTESSPNRYAHGNTYRDVVQGHPQGNPD
jgi:hypothetical protein